MPGRRADFSTVCELPAELNPTARALGRESVRRAGKIADGCQSDQNQKCCHEIAHCDPQNPETHTLLRAKQQCDEIKATKRLKQGGLTLPLVNSQVPNWKPQPVLGDQNDPVTVLDELVATP